MNRDAIEFARRQPAWQIGARRLLESREWLQGLGVVSGPICAIFWWMDASRMQLNRADDLVKRFKEGGNPTKLWLALRGGFLTSARPIAWMGMTLALSGVGEALTHTGLLYYPSIEVLTGQIRGERAKSELQVATMQTTVSHSLAGGLAGGLIGALTIDKTRGMGYFVVGRSLIRKSSRPAAALLYMGAGLFAGAGLPSFLAILHANRKRN